MLTKENAKQVYYILWLNLVLGLYNIFLYQYYDRLWYLIIGGLNIGAWVFFRDTVKKFLK